MAAVVLFCGVDQDTEQIFGKGVSIRSFQAQVKEIDAALPAHIKIKQRPSRSQMKVITFHHQRPGLLLFLPLVH